MHIRMQGKSPILHQFLFLRKRPLTLELPALWVSKLKHCYIFFFSKDALKCLKVPLKTFLMLNDFDFK